MASNDRKNWIRAEAYSFGFSFTGFTTVEPLEAETVRYVDWLRRGCHGEMAYLERADAIAKRADPRALFPDGRSAIVFGVRIGVWPRPDRGYQVADFARYYDYHDTIPVRLNELFERYKRVFASELRWKICADSSPVFERALAVRAGLGWIGRSSMLIHPRFGSKTLLAVAFTDAAFEADAPFIGEWCGSCRRCVEACPMGCIDGEMREIDARRCISYLTIERKSSLEAELWERIGTRVFGCDVCTDVCPWNRSAMCLEITPAKTSSGILIPNGAAFPDERDFELTQATFKEKYCGSPILRRKLPRWLANLENAGRNWR